MDTLTEAIQHTIAECLRAAVEGPFLQDTSASDPFWEFSTLIGLTPDEVRTLLANWPTKNPPDAMTYLAISNILNNLLGYPHGQLARWSEYISAPPEEVHRILGLWHQIAPT